MSNINELVNGHEIESASPLAHAVRYDRVQVKSDEQKRQARSNMGAAAAADLTTQTGRITKAMHMIAPDYSATSTYAKGDLVVHGDKLYKCSTAIATAEAWTAAHWTETTMAEAGGGGGSGGGGSGGGVALEVHVTSGGSGSSYAIDKTYSEVVEAARTGLVVLIDEVYTIGTVAHFLSAGPNAWEGGYLLNFDGYNMKADSTNDYPHFSGM